MTDLITQYLSEITTRLERLAVAGGPIDDAIALITDSLEAGGVVQAFGTGHSEAFAMEIAGRAGGLIATNRIALRTLVLRGDRDVSELGGAEFEREPNAGENLLALFDAQLAMLAALVAGFTWQRRRSYVHGEQEAAQRPSGRAS